ncbi:MAG: hypothetical protein RMJ98_17380, partial [Myxococcales bacterium]|nr:tetratricopeptide repeat protein [Polyangiaceae bacterium]MDW8251069.1 hypothetical protein [Myxococcales bacterium]
SPSLGQTGTRSAAPSTSFATHPSEDTTPPIQGETPPTKPSALPSWLQDRRVQLGAGGAGFFLLLLVVVLSFRGRSTPTTPPATSASTSASASPSPAPTLSEEEITEANKQGTKALLALKDKAPQDARVLRALAKAYVEQKNTEEALAVFGELFTLEPSASNNPEIQEALLSLTLGEKKPEPVFSFLEEKAGSGGLDVLYALLVSPKSSLFVKKKAGESLHRHRDRASPALKVVLDLRTTASVGPKAICSQATKLRQIFAEAKEHGDGRALLFLTPMTGVSKECGTWYKKTNCYACLQGDGKLNEAIAAIRNREQQKK